VQRDTAPANDEPAYGWVVVGACCLSLAVIFGVSYAFAALFESYAREFGAQRADVSLVFGLTGLLYFSLGAFAGMAADRFGPRVVASAGMVCISAGLLAASQAQSLSQVVLAQGLLVGLGVALVYTPSIACVQPWFTRRRGLAAGIASAGIGAGTLLVPLLVTAALSLLPWRQTLMLVAAGTLILGLSGTLLLKRAPAAARPPGATHAPGLSLREAVASTRFRWMYLMTLIGAVPMFVPFAHVSAAARDQGVPDAAAVGLVGLIGLGSLVGRFVIGALADRLGRPSTLVLATAALGLSFGLWLLGGGYTVMALFALVMGLSYGGTVSLLPALCMDYFGARSVSAIIGTLYTGAALGNLLGPVAAGWVFDHTGSYSPVVWACLALGLLSSWCAHRSAR
jgi:MFS family permease